jgi:hypothetical protein
MVCRLNPFPSCQDGRAPSEVDIRRGEVVDALVVAAMVVVGDKGGDLGFEIAGQVAVFQQVRFLSVWWQRSILPWVIG